ncbi:MAG TPA: O-antigen ligase family protein, partial [Bryobacteraceae bacterium]|nr:O-antigen ligase family protein [Bryobacteraceae bacterium]
METLSWRRTNLALPLTVGTLSAAAVLAPDTPSRLAIVVPCLAAMLGLWCLQGPQRWVWAFFFCLLLAPPLPFPLGDTGIHIAPALALLGVLVGLVRLPEWRLSLPPVALALLAFLAVITMSAGMAAFYSGAVLALGSALRVGLFGIGVYVFLYALLGPRDPGTDSTRGFRYLFFLGMIAALFGCVDYYYQLPAPAGFGAQYIWLEEGMFRRAQGLFYEASTLGNFSAFFLVMIAVAWFRPSGETPCSRPLLLTGGLLFGGALALSWSRASVLNVLVACTVLMLRRKTRIGRLLIGAAVAIPVGVLALQTLLPSVAASYWTRLARSVQYLGYSPDGVLSGRLTHWMAIADFLIREPWHAILGIGYKTLPYTNVTGAPVIADNTWLSLLAETGLVGVAVFAVLNWQIL